MAQSTLALNVLGAVVLGVGLAAVAAAAWVVHVGRAWHDAVSRFDDVETTTVDTLAGGPVALTGTVRAAEDADPVTGPLSGEEGVAVHSEVATGNRRRIRQWVVDWTPFELEDGTGRVRVELPDELRSREAQLRRDGLAARPFWGLDYDFVEEARAGFTWGDDDHDPALDEPFDLQFGGDAIPPGRVRAYRERVVQPGDEVFLMGEAERSGGGWDAPEWTVTADGPESFVVSDALATEEGREADRRERTYGRWVGYLFGAFALAMGLVAGALGLVVAADPLLAVLYLLGIVPLVGSLVGLGVLAVRRGTGLFDAVGFAERSIIVTVALGLASVAGGGRLIADRYAATRAPVVADAWLAYALLAVGLFLLWSGLSTFLYLWKDIDLPLRGTVPGEE